MATFLKCDAPGCDHREDRPDLLESDIGRPCPKCGANLLTREDYDAAKPFIEMMRALETAGLVGVTAILETASVVTVNHHAADVHIKIKGAKNAEPL